MSSAVVLELDTTAPVVTWGGVSGAAAGQALVVEFTVDEPDLISAELVLSDGRTRVMTLIGGELSVLLPADTPGTTHHIEALVRDEVGNEAVRSLAVVIDGIPVPQPEPTVQQRGGAPPARLSLRRSRRESKSRIAVRGFADTAVVELVSSSRPAVASRFTVEPGEPEPIVVLPPAPAREVIIRSRITVRGEAGAVVDQTLEPSTVTVRSRYSIHPDDTDDALSVLLLA